MISILWAEPPVIEYPEVCTVEPAARTDLDRRVTAARSAGDPYPKHDIGGINRPASLRCWLGLHAWEKLEKFMSPMPYTDTLFGAECRRCGERQTYGHGTPYAPTKNNIAVHARASRWQRRA